MTTCALCGDVAQSPAHECLPEFIHRVNVGEIINRDGTAIPSNVLDNAHAEIQRLRSLLRANLSPENYERWVLGRG